ncbi:MAG: MerR family transcriptional regulator [Merdibacter sp.]
MCPSGWGSRHRRSAIEKKGLLPNIRRTKGGIRQFDEETIEWLKLIECLKKTGLSLTKIREFMDMSTQGDATIPQRLALFQRQRDAIREEIRQLEEILHLVDYKCWYYETAKDEGTLRLLPAKRRDFPQEYQESAAGCGK